MKDSRISPISLSVVIPTYNRGDVLLDTIKMLIEQRVPANEIIVVDQTAYDGDDKVLSSLVELHDRGSIVLMRRTSPSIPAAMNAGLLAAQSTLVLFLDDDIKVEPDFIVQHMSAWQLHESAAHTGQVFQPWDSEAVDHVDDVTETEFMKSLKFNFCSSKSAEIVNCMAGNLCVDRLQAIESGGFDEAFVGAAYRFESEFARRLSRDSGKQLSFQPSPRIYHLKLSTGGTRKSHNFLTSASWWHSVGDYYFALLEARGIEQVSYIVKRLLFSVKAKFYLQKPWYIPVRFVGEVRGLLKALRLYAAGQRLVSDE